MPDQASSDERLLLAGITPFLLAGLAMGGCGGSDTTGEPDSGPQIGVTHENVVLVSELRGLYGEDERGVPVQVMLPRVNVRAYPVNRDWEIRGDEFDLGCFGKVYDLQSGDKLPNEWGDMGIVELTGHSGTGGGVDSATIAPVISCSLSDDIEHGYSCTGVPKRISEGPIDDLQLASFFDDGDTMRFTATGGPATQDRQLRIETFEMLPALKVSSPELAGSNTINMEADLPIQFSCPDDPHCGAAHILRFAVSDNPDPFGAPIRYYSEADCTYMPPDPLEIPAEVFEMLNRNPWKVMMIQVYRITFPAGIFPYGVASIGRGEFFLNYNEEGGDE